jgi:DNA-binding GntR family transcriptional regulator
MSQPRERVSHSLADHIADTLRSGITAGTYPAGTRLPSISELAAEHDAARGTVQKAIDALRNDGLIKVWRGKGAFVLDRAGHGDAPQATIDGLYSLVRRLLDRIESVEQRLDASGPAAPKETARTQATKESPRPDSPKSATVDDLYSLVLRLYDRVDGWEQHLNSTEGHQESQPR